MKRLFHPKDFIASNVAGDGVEMQAQWSADRANEKLEKFLSEQPIVYGGVINNFIRYRWYSKPWAGLHGRTTHTARLCCIEEIEK